jgi:hypothetical protein
MLLLRAEDIPSVATSGVWQNTQTVFDAAALVPQAPATLAASVDAAFPSAPTVIVSHPAINGYPALLFYPGAGATNQNGASLVTPVNLATPGQAFTVFILAAINATSPTGAFGGPVVTDAAANANGSVTWCVGWCGGLSVDGTATTGWEGGKANAARVAGQTFGVTANPVAGQWELYEFMQSAGGTAMLMKWGAGFGSSNAMAYNVYPAPAALGPNGIRIGAVGPGTTASMVAEVSVPK